MLIGQLLSAPPSVGASGNYFVCAPALSTRCPQHSIHHSGVSKGLFNVKQGKGKDCHFYSQPNLRRLLKLQVV